MRKGKEVKDKTRNNRFVEAFDYLRRNSDMTTRKQLAAMMGVSKDTITRIMHAYTPFTDDAITKFQTATGCIFNLQWLRGESDMMMSIDAGRKSTSAVENLHQSTQIDQSSLMNATIAAQQTSIESLKRELIKTEESARREIQKAEDFAKRELSAKQETIDILRGQLKDKDATIAAKDAELAEKNARLADKQALIAGLQDQVSDLRAQLAFQQTKDAIGSYPFTIGVADEGRKAQV